MRDNFSPIVTNVMKRILMIVQIFDTIVAGLKKQENSKINDFKIHFREALINYVTV
jgi:hypothetical protein